jgi:DNA-binding NtrC family response regulator
MNGDTASLDGKRILIIEDDFLVAQVLVGLLEDAGALVLGPIGWIDEAIAFIKDDTQRFDGAVLDVNLHGQKSYPIADALAARKVGFVFATGYGASVLEGRYQQYPRCEKPFDQAALVTALAAL